MTLQQIDRRLELYLEYLPYMIAGISKKIRDDTAANTMKIFQDMGILFIHNGTPYYGPVSFDEWLSANGHNELALTTNKL